MSPLIGNRKLLVAFFAMLSASILCFLSKISPDVYSTVMLASAGSYIAGNVFAKHAKD